MTLDDAVSANRYGKYVIAVDSDYSGRHEQLMRSVWLTVILVFLFCMVCLAVVVFLVTVFFVRPLREFRKNLDTIGRGTADLSIRLEIKGNDEISDTARTFNNFIAHLNTMIADLKANASQTGLVEQKLFAASQRTAVSINQIRSNTAAISKSAELLKQDAGDTNALSENVSVITQYLVEAIRHQTQANTARAFRLLQRISANLPTMQKRIPKPLRIPSKTSSTGHRQPHSLPKRQSALLQTSIAMYIKRRKPLFPCGNKLKPCQEQRMPFSKPSSIYAGNKNSWLRARRRSAVFRQSLPAPAAHSKVLQHKSTPA